VEHLGAVVRARSSVVILSALLWGRAAAANEISTPVRVEINRAPGSELCPDEARVFDAVTRLFPEGPLRRTADAAAAVLDVSIAIAPSAEGHEARLRVQENPGAERLIVDRDAACGGLADALAVALVLWSSSAEEELAVAPPEAAGPASPSEAASVSPPEQPEPSRKPDQSEQPEEPAKPERPEQADSPSELPLVLGVEANALAGFGVLGEPAFGASAGFSAWSVLGVGLGARVRLLRAFAMSVEVPPGAVDVDLWAGLFDVCVRFEPGVLWSIVPCVELGWGEQRAEAIDLAAENDEARRRWIALGPSVSLLFHVGGPLRVMGTGAFLVHLHDQSYAVDRQVVASHPRTGGYVGLGALAEWDLSTKIARE
jgi:hypothetical protein